MSRFRRTSVALENAPAAQLMHRETYRVPAEVAGFFYDARSLIELRVGNKVYSNKN